MRVTIKKRGTLKIYLMARPVIQWQEWKKFADDEKLDAGAMQPTRLRGVGDNQAERLVEVCGRLCYMSFGNGRSTTEEHIANLISSGHFSVLEHPHWTFFITGVTRSLTHELVRHRHFSYSQLSQRYVDHKAVKFIPPPAVAGDPSLQARWEAFTDEVRTFYAELEDALATLPKKEHRTAARCVLPNCTETKIAVTGNARAWREFIGKRNVATADPEIHRLAGMLLDRLAEDSPALFGDLLP